MDPEKLPTVSNKTTSRDRIEDCDTNIRYTTVQGIGCRPSLPEASSLIRSQVIDQLRCLFQIAAELSRNHRWQRWFMRSRSTDGWTASAEFSPHNPPLNDSTDATQHADSDGTSGCVTEFASEIRLKKATIRNIVNNDHHNKTAGPGSCTRSKAANCPELAKIFPRYSPQRGEFVRLEGGRSDASSSFDRRRTVMQLRRSVRQCFG